MSSEKRGLPNTLYLSLVTIEPSSEMPLYRQIYRGLRDAITNGRLPANTKLPSTRDLSTIWNVSRNTLRNAFDQLIAEGYLEAIVGRGTFVMQQETRPLPKTKKPATDRIRPISTIGRILEPIGKSIHQPPTATGNAFTIGVPDLTVFPYKIWNRIVNRCQKRMQHDPTLGNRVNGIWPLREAIASYLVSARGLNCVPEQIDIVPGSVTGMFIAALALLGPHDQVWMEEPGYISVSALLRYRGIELFPLPVDDQGLDVEAGIQKAPEARLAYVTPSHQYPLGVTMSLARRRQLLDWAAQNNSWILEDDYDSEFRYDEPPISALQGLDNDQRVIYCGTFSKILMSELRLGYIVLPPDLIDVYTGVKMPITLLSSVLIQAAVAEFMLEGHYVRHIRHMRKHYQARRDALVEAVNRHLAGAITLGATDCGMHAVGYLADGFDETAVVQKAHQLGMILTPLSYCFVEKPTCSGVIIGFANVQPEEIDGYFKKLAEKIL